MVDVQGLLRTERFLEELSLSVRKILFSSFPNLTEQEKEEIGQDVRLKILKMAARGKKVDNLRSYIWKMVYSTALDAITKRTTAVSLDEMLSAHAPPLRSFVDALSPELLYESRELYLLVEKSIDALPPRRKSAVLLHIQGLDLDETAALLGESRHTVRHLVYRGLNDLREALRLPTRRARRADARARKIRPAGVPE